MKAAIMRERATTAMDLRMKSSLCRADRMDRRWLDFSPDFGDTDPRPEGFNRVSRVPWQGYDTALAPERSPPTSPIPAARRLRGFSPVRRRGTVGFLDRGGRVEGDRASEGAGVAGAGR